MDIQQGDQTGATCTPDLVLTDEEGMMDAEYAFMHPLRKVRTQVVCLNLF